jgi:hypothetical protein
LRNTKVPILRKRLDNHVLQISVQYDKGVKH